MIDQVIEKLISDGWPLALVSLFLYPLIRLFWRACDKMVSDGGLLDAASDAFRAVPEEMRGLKTETILQTEILKALQDAHEDPESLFSNVKVQESIDEMSDELKTVLAIVGIGLRAIERAQELHSWSVPCREDLEKMRRLIRSVSVPGSDWVPKKSKGD